MAKYNWKELEKEYILGDYKSVSAFLEIKKIPCNGNTKKQTKGWADRKVQRENEKSTKIIEKVIEKEANKEANDIVSINNVAQSLLKKIEILSQGTDDERSIKSLTSALKDINDIVNNNGNDPTDKNYLDELEQAWRKRNEK